MFHRLLIATVVGILAAFAVAGFRHAMLLLEWLFLSAQVLDAGFARSFVAVNLTLPDLFWG